MTVSFPFVCLSPHRGSRCPILSCRCHYAAQVLSCTKYSTVIQPQDSRSDNCLCMQLELPCQDLEDVDSGQEWGEHRARAAWVLGLLLGGCVVTAVLNLFPQEKGLLPAFGAGAPATPPASQLRRHMKSVCVYLPATSGESYGEILQCLIPGGHWDFRERRERTICFPCLNATGSFLCPS